MPATKRTKSYVPIPKKSEDELNKSLKAVEAVRPRCRKCVYEMRCTKDKDNEHKCPDYKRDAADGGYYG